MAVQFLQRQRHAAEARGQRLRVFQRAVGHQQAFDLVVGEVTGGQFDRVAGADQQDRGLVERGEHALRQPHRGECHRDRVRADAGIGTGALGHREGLLEQAIQRGLQRALAACHLPGFLHLAEDLRLAQHHRIQTGGDAEQVPHRIALLVAVEVGIELVRAQLAVARQPVLGQALGSGFHAAIDFGAVAGGQQRSLGHARLCQQVAQHPGQRGRRDREFLAQRDRRGLVIQSEGEQGHGTLGLDFQCWRAFRAHACAKRRRADLRCNDF